MQRQSGLTSYGLKTETWFSRSRFYSARLGAVLDRAKAEGAVSGSMTTEHAATMFLSLIQGLGFQLRSRGCPSR
jgi:hypothetical protein